MENKKMNIGNTENIGNIENIEKNKLTNANQQIKYAFANYIKKYFNENDINQIDVFKLSTEEFKEKYNITQEELQNKLKSNFDLELQKNISNEIENKKIQREKEREKHIQMIMNQTEYSYEEAVHKYDEKNGEYIEIIREYINNGNNKEDVPDNEYKNKSLNQKIYTEIRNFMDKQKSSLT